MDKIHNIIFTCATHKNNSQLRKDNVIRTQLQEGGLFPLYQKKLQEGVSQ